MTRLFSITVMMSWGLGVVSGLAAVAVKLVPAWGAQFNVAPRGGLLLASTLFLCALATRGMEQR